jgi:hypothetical protein
MKNYPLKFMQNLNIIWNPTQMKVLGIWITNTLKECSKQNYEENFYEVRKLMLVWLKTIEHHWGRVAILKSLILSKIIHLCLLLPRPHEHTAKDVLSICLGQQTR